MNLISHLFTSLLSGILIRIKKLKLKSNLLILKDPISLRNKITKIISKFMQMTFQ